MVTRSFLEFQQTQRARGGMLEPEEVVQAITEIIGQVWSETVPYPQLVCTS